MWSVTIFANHEPAPCPRAYRCGHPHGIRGEFTLARARACLIGHGKGGAIKAELAPGSTSKLVTDGNIWLPIPPSPTPLACTVYFTSGAALSIPKDHAATDFLALTKGGPRRWPQTVDTTLKLGQQVEGYAADDLALPLANPYGSWMRTTALDFLSDGRMAVATLSGDVWLVSQSKDNPGVLTWSRFATGIYEPLGLKVVNDVILVRGRDRITRLHDLNKDGEADYYESFYEDRNEIGTSYHAFVYDLQTDRAGNFYFSQSGYKSPLTGGVVRVTPDGTKAEFFGTDT